MDSFRRRLGIGLQEIIYVTVDDVIYFFLLVYHRVRYLYFRPVFRATLIVYLIYLLLEILRIVCIGSQWKGIEGSINQVIVIEYFILFPLK